MTTLDNNYNNHAFDTVFQSDFILNKFKKSWHKILKFTP